MGTPKEKVLEMEKEKLARTSRVDRLIMDELLKMRLDYRYTGTHHLHDAILLSINTNLEEFGSAREFLNRIYSKVRAKYGIKQNNHLIAMTCAIERAFSKGNIDYLLDVFKYSYNPDTGIVDNRTFVMTVRERIKYELREGQALGISDLRTTIQEAVEKITDISALTSLCGIALALKGGGGLSR